MTIVLVGEIEANEVVVVVIGIDVEVTQWMRL